MLYWLQSQDITSLPLTNNAAFSLDLLILGTLIVIGGIVIFRVGAFLALISAAMVLSVYAPGEMSDKISRVAEAFGTSAGKIGIVIALATVIGKCMMDSGAADRIVRAFLSLLGVKRGPLALMTSGYVLSVPVFFDTVFYLLVPLARSMYRQTNKGYLAFIVAIGAGGAITHTLVPPTPGPMVMADALQFDVGVMILVGGAIGLPCSLIGMYWGIWLDKKMNIPMRPLADSVEPDPLEDHELPSLFTSLLPVILPVLMITSNTVIGRMADSAEKSHAAIVAASKAENATITDAAVAASAKTSEAYNSAAEIAAVIGNPNLALFVSAVISILVYVVKRKPTRTELGRSIEVSLMSGGVIILITAAGGAFGAMLQAAEVGDAIKQLFSTEDSSSQMSAIGLIMIGYLLASLLKISQGSGTVAMITASQMVAALIYTDSATDASLPMHPVYIACAIGSGSLMVSWMNDSGFWIFAKMGGLTEVEALKSWTSTLAIMSVAGLVLTCLLATIFPMVS